MTDHIVSSPAYDARHAFDGDHNVEPCRTVAKRIAIIHDISPMHPLVDDIAHAIEDARALGEKLGRVLAKFDI